MSNLTSIERIKLERLFDMELGYVLEFSNSSFEAFFLEELGIEIYSEKYQEKGNSKAKRLRSFWELSPNYLVAKSIELMVDYGKAKGWLWKPEQNEELVEECLKVSERLVQESGAENLEAIRPMSDDRDFNILASEIRKSISSNQPEVALDRLHTFVIKYIRELCTKHQLEFDKETPLHSLFGGYVKHLAGSGVVKSKMSILILKSSISVLDSFNFVRNNHSFAHDNDVILSYDESMLIFNDISNLVRFIESIEKTFDQENEFPF